MAEPVLLLKWSAEHRPIDWRKIAIELFADKEGWDADITHQEAYAVESAYRQKYHLEG